MTDKKYTHMKNTTSPVKMQNVQSSPTWSPYDLDFTQYINVFQHVIFKILDRARILKSNLISSAHRFSKDFEFIEWFSVEGLITITLFAIILSSILIISVNIYRKIRYAIPARVNCWFCNTNTKVLYSLKDTWTCPTCHQYNGFTPDGHYNKRIPAQFMEALNRPMRGAPAKGYQLKQGGSSSNGLCSQCNLNQVLKVFQLASFVPVNERNYDAEIEAEQKRLEQLYDICDQCKNIVERALALSTMADKEQSTGLKNKIKVNKVVPTPTVSPHSIRASQSKNENSPGLTFLHDDCLKDASDTSDNSGDSFLSLDNLKIGSKNKTGLDFHMPSSPLASRSNSPQSYHPCSSSMSYCTYSPVYNSTMQLHQDATPIWKDYPLVQGRSSPTYSVIDSINCPVGRPVYGAYSAQPPPSQFSYQSSNIGGVFGGRKPLIFPPKFSNTSTPMFAPFIRYGPYYDVSAASQSATGNHSQNPIMLSPHCFTNPISRSSSQSSGFVSQHGGGTLSPQSQVHTPTRF